MYTHQRLSVFLMSFAVAGAAWAYPEYKVTVVGPAGSVPNGINAAGVVVGYYPVGTGVTHAFLNRGKGLVDLGTFRGTSSTAVAINDKGQVLGHWTTSGGQVRGYIRDGGRTRDIGVIGGGDTTWTDINNAGYVSGYTFADSYLRAPNGMLTTLGHLPGDDPAFPPRTEAYALNNRNQVTGASGSGVPIDPLFHGFIWQRGRISDLGSLGGIGLAGTPAFSSNVNLFVAVNRIRRGNVREGSNRARPLSHKLFGDTHEIDVEACKRHVVADLRRRICYRPNGRPSHCQDDHRA